MSKQPDQTLGGFFICYKERTAVEKALESFYQFYPQARVYLSSDGGFDYSYLEPRYPGLKCMLDPEQTVGMMKNVGQSDPITPLFMAAFEFLNRLNRGVQWCRTGYLLLMEPDVFVRGPLTLPDAELAGPKENSMPPRVLQFIESRGGRNNFQWGAAAGVMQTEPFLQIFREISERPWLLLEALECDKQIVCYDYLLAFFFSLFGYRYEKNSDLVECLRVPNWRTSRHPLLHQYRENYGTRADEAGKHHFVPQPDRMTNLKPASLPIGFAA